MFLAAEKTHPHTANTPLGKKICWMIPILVLAIAAAFVFSGCAIGTNGAGKRSGKSYVINGKRYYILSTAEGYKEKGLASWYGVPFHGRKTASGEVYNMYEYSAAHKTLPLQTWVEVKNLKTSKKMYLRINDRGPFIDGRIIDLSQAAAKELGVYQPGVIEVVVTAVPADKAKKLAAQQKPPGRYSLSRQERRMARN